MKKLLTLIVVAGSLGVCHAQQSNLLAVASSQQEVPATDYTQIDGTYASANFTFTGNTTSGGTLSITSDGFFGNSYAPTEISVNDAPAGVNGPVLFTLSVVFESPVGGGLYNGLFSGSGTLSGTQAADLENGDLYINVQTAVSQGAGQTGEVRGQILQVPEPCSMTLMGLGSVTWLAMRRRKS